ncbi:hypothetical protein AB7C87_01790 [Natrarchaeobius sp. A-rgal3]|uniref:hypothetical protein n=1 Tax=Natrarchaeobius versutus TaxID=1679078 RepID=UPI00350EE456
MSETVEYAIAWAVIMIVSGLLLIGFLWVVLDVFVQHVVAEAGDTPAYSADRVDYTMHWLRRFWLFIPTMALGSLIAWGLVRAVAARGGAV